MVDTSSIRPQRVEYPESDGLPMAESDITRDYLVYCVEALRLFYQSRPQVYVSGNLFIYYEEGNAKKNLAPDVFVVFGVSKRERRTYKVWQEAGKLPAFVLEITSLTTRRKDEVEKPKLYAELGIQEYFQYDPSGDYLKPQLKGQTLVDGRYIPIQPKIWPDSTVSVPSQTLGLDLRLLPLSASTHLPVVAPVARELRLFDPKTEAKLLTYREAEQAKQEAEQARQEAEQARQESEQARQEAEQARQEAEQARQESEQVAADERLKAEQTQQQLQTLLNQLKAQGIDPQQFLG